MSDQFAVGWHVTNDGEKTWTKAPGKLSHSAQHSGSVSVCNSQDVDEKQKFLVYICINSKGWLLVGSDFPGRLDD